MPKTDTAHRSPKKQLGSRFSGMIIIIFTLLLVGIFSLFYFQKITQREKLAGFLPADRTIALFEYNLEADRTDSTEVLGMLQQNALISQLSDNLQLLIPFRDQFDKWYSGRGGVAILSSSNGHDFQTSIFLGVKNAEAVNQWLESLLLDPNADALLDEDFYGQKLISFKTGQNLHILWTKEYLVLSEDKETLQAIAQSAAGKSMSLRQMPIYNQISSALPEQNLGFLFLDRHKLLEILSKNDRFLGGRLALFKLYFPFLNLIGNEGVSIRKATDPDGRPALLFNHLSLFNQSVLTDKSLFETTYFYDGRLERYLPSSNNMFLAGGVNLLDQKNKLQSFLGTDKGLNDLLFAGVENMLQDALSTSSQQVNLDTDFYPLFRKNYLFFLNPASGQLVDFGLLIESEQPENDLLKLKKVLLAYGPKLAMQFLAKPTPVTLPDGTIGSEMTAEITTPAQKIITISGYQIEQIEFGSAFSIYILADAEEQLLIVSNSQSALKDILEKAPDKDGKTVDYKLEKASEVYFLDTSKLATLWPQLTQLAPVQYLKVARKFTEIGILSTYQIGF